MTRYEELSDKLAGMIERGVLRPGERIPSLRRAMARHGASPATVLQAYSLLEARGLIEARPRSGFYVRARRPKLTPAPGPSSPHSRGLTVDVNSLVFRILDAMKNREVVPLGSAFPGPELFPLDA